METMSSVSAFPLAVLHDHSWGGWSLVALTWVVQVSHVVDKVVGDAKTSQQQIRVNKLVLCDLNILLHVDIHAVVHPARVDILGFGHSVTGAGSELTNGARSRGCQCCR